MLKNTVLSLALCASLFAQHDASLNVNSDDLEINANIDIGELNQVNEPDTYFLTLGFLDVDNAQKTDPLLQAGFKLRQDVQGIEGLRFGLGIKGVHTKVSNSSYTAVPIGAEVVYTLPIDSTIPVVVSASLDYAPSVLAFQHADSYMERRVEIGVNVIEQATVFLGYRKIDTDFEGNRGDYKFSSGGYVGFKVRF